MHIQPWNTRNPNESNGSQLVEWFWFELNGDRRMSPVPRVCAPHTNEVSVIRKADSETLGKVAQAVTEQACLPLLTWKILALVRLFLL